VGSAGGPGGGTAFDLGDLLGGGLGDLFGGVFGGRRVGPRRGADLETETTVDFADAARGVTVPLRISAPQVCATCHGSGARPGTAPKPCTVCNGTGQTTRAQGGFAFADPCRACRGRGAVVEDPCPTCHGVGSATADRTLTVRIPPGVTDAQRIRLSGRGRPGENGGPAGDLFVVVHVRPHAYFGRNGSNLTLSLPVTFPEAALGATVSVPTLDEGPVSVKIPAGTTSGRVLRLKGKGVHRRNGTPGDLLITVEVAVPAKLDSTAKAALEAYRAAAEGSDGADPRAHLFAATTGGGG
jgi:molecular chaperone DnaJ